MMRQTGRPGYLHVWPPFGGQRQSRRRRAELPGYTLGMKTAISIPDEVFAEAERLARRLKKSRSELYSHALREYVARHGPEYITETLDRICAASPPDKDFATAAARRTLRRSPW
jgi:predicted transcriptional regulator